MSTLCDPIDGSPPGFPIPGILQARVLEWGAIAISGSVGDLGSIHGLGRSPGEGNGNPLQYLVWEIPWTKGPGGLQSVGSQRVGHDGTTNTFTFVFRDSGALLISWRHPRAFYFCVYKNTNSDADQGVQNAGAPSFHQAQL